MLVVQPAFYSFYYILPRGPQRWFWSNKLVNISLYRKLIFNFISMCLESLRIQNSPTECQVEMSMPFGTFLCTNGDGVLAAARAFKATWLSEQILKYFPGVTSIWISSTQTKIAYILAWKTVAYFPKEILGLLPKDCHRLWPQSPPYSGPICLPNEPLNCRRNPRSCGPLFSNQHSNPILRFKVKCWPHNSDHHIKYGIRLLKLHQYNVNRVQHRGISLWTPMSEKNHRKFLVFQFCSK